MMQLSDTMNAGDVRRVRPVSTATRLIATLAVAVLLAGCAASRAFNRANDAASAQEWDVAVEQYRAALQREPDNPEYRAALLRAMQEASRFYAEQGRIAELRGQTEPALRAYRRASEFDPSNRALAAKVTQIERQIRDQAEAAAPESRLQQLQAARQPVGPPPLAQLSEVLTINFTNANARDVLAGIGQLAGINVVFERDFAQARAITVQLDLVTLEDALNQIMSANGFFYKVLNQRTIMVIEDTQPKRLLHEDQVVGILRLSHADATEMFTVINQVIRIAGSTSQANFQVSANKTQNTLTYRAPASMAAILERFVRASDKPRAEVVVDVEILEVNRQRLKQYGLDLGNYTIGTVFSPEVDPRANGALTSPAINLDSLAGPLTRSDLYLSLPAAAIRFLEQDSETKLLARPQLRGTEGETLTLDLGEEVPVPQTVFTPIAAGGPSSQPLSSFNYRTVGIRLVMIPRVTYEDEIIIDLEVENSTLGPDIDVGGSNLPTFSTRRVTARLRLRDGEANLLAGLIRESDRRNLRGFPAILRVPIIKQLFSANEVTVEQTDIIILLTPRIVRTHELTQEDVDPIFIGASSSIGLTTSAPSIVQEPAAAQPQPGAAAAPAPAPAPGNQGAAPPPPAAPAADGAAAGAAGGRILLTPNAVEVRAGTDGLLVPISVTDTSRLSRVSITVTYNPAVLRIRGVQQGSFMEGGGAKVTFTEDRDTPGQVDIVILRTGDTVGAAGTGLLAALQFDTIGPGQANLGITGTAAAPGGGALSVQFGQAPAVLVK